MKRTEKEIEFYTEVLKLMVMSLLADIGGMAGLFYKLENPVTLVLLGVGLWFAISLIVGLIIVVSKIQELLRRME